MKRITKVEKGSKMKKKVISLVWVGIVSASTCGLFVRWAEAPSLVLAMYRKLFAALILGVPVFLHNRQELKAMTRSQWLWCILSGIFLGIHFTLYFEAMQSTTMAAAQVLAGGEVIFVALAMFFLGRERYSRQCVLGIFLAIAGNFFVTVGDSGTASRMLYGDICAIVCAVFLALYSLIGAEQRKNISSNVYNFVVYGSAAVFLAVAVGVSPYSYTGYRTTDYLCAFAMTVVGSLMGHGIFNWSIKYLSPTYVAMLKIFTPVITAVLAMVVFGEYLRPGQLAAGLLVMGGILVYTAAKRKREPEAQKEEKKN